MRSRDYAIHNTNIRLVNNGCFALAQIKPDTIFIPDRCATRMQTAANPRSEESAASSQPAWQFGIDARDILVELGKRKVVGGQEDMIVEVALMLADRQKQGSATS